MTDSPPHRTPRLGHVVAGTLLVGIGVLWFIEAASDVDIPWTVLLPIALIVVGGALVYGSPPPPPRAAARPPATAGCSRSACSSP